MTRLEFEQSTHTYTLDGAHVPSVTQVLDPLLELEGIPAHLLEAARVLGTNAHIACDLMVRGRLDWAALDPALRPYVEGECNFLADTGFVVIASELRVASARLGCAGTLDLKGSLNGALAIIDRKTTSVLPPTVGPQTAAYEEFDRAERGGRQRKRFCLQLGPQFARGYKLHPLTDSRDYSWFLSALNLYRFREIYGIRNKSAR